MAPSFSGPARDIDIVDDADAVVGTMLRADLAHRPHNFRVAHIFVFDSTDRLVLGQLGTERTNDPGLWGSSVAAHLWAGETYEEAARRRLAEELGVDDRVSSIGKLRFPEHGVTKFVSLFTATAESYDRREPAHVTSLKPITRTDLLSQIETTPGKFTPTFRALIAEFGKRLWRS
jgi:isopentenyl-diphosphate delta-isomerase